MSITDVRFQAEIDQADHQLAHEWQPSWTHYSFTRWIESGELPIDHPHWDHDYEHDERPPWELIDEPEYEEDEWLDTWKDPVDLYGMNA